MLFFSEVCINDYPFSFCPISFVKMDIPGLKNAPTGSMQEDIGSFMLRIAKVSTLNGFSIKFLMFFMWNMCEGFAAENANVRDGRFVFGIGLKWGKITFYDMCGSSIDNVYSV